MSVETHESEHKEKQHEQQHERQWQDRPKNTTKLHIRNLPYDVNKEDVAELCRRYGTFTQLEIKGTNGFVTFSKPDEATTAIYDLLNVNTTFKGFKLNVSYAKERLPDKQDTKQEAKPEATATTEAADKPSVAEKKALFSAQQQLAKKTKPKTTFNNLPQQNNNQNKQPQQQKQKQKPKQEPKVEEQPNPVVVEQPTLPLSKKQKKKLAQQEKAAQGQEATKTEPVKPVEKKPTEPVKKYRVTVENLDETRDVQAVTFEITQEQYLEHIFKLYPSNQNVATKK